jgi:phosphopentomutase
MNKKLSGDIFIELQPGWTVVNENQTGKTDYTREKAILPPLIFFGGNVRKEHVFRPVRATEIAPTVAFILRIPSPNAAQDAPLQEFIK